MDIGSTRGKGPPREAGAGAELSTSGEPRGGAGAGAVAKEAERGRDSGRRRLGGAGGGSEGRKTDLREEVETLRGWRVWERPGKAEVRQEWTRRDGPRNPEELGRWWSLCISEGLSIFDIGLRAGWGLASAALVWLL